MSTSHEYLYEMDREQLFSMFVGAVASLRVDDDGCHCHSAEAQGFARMARVVQARVDPADAREDRLGTLATITRVVLSRTDALDRGEMPSDYAMPMSELVAYFIGLRDDCRDFIPAPAASMPDSVPAEFIESLRDGPNPDGQPGVTFDACGRPWIEPDPDDEEWSDEQVAALPHCVGCHEPMVPDVDHSACRRLPEPLHD